MEAQGLRLNRCRVSGVSSSGFRFGMLGPWVAGGAGRRFGLNIAAQRARKTWRRAGLKTLHRP